jgi:hypothetical protein
MTAYDYLLISTCCVTALLLVAVGASIFLLRQARRVQAESAKAHIAIMFAAQGAFQAHEQAAKTVLASLESLTVLLNSSQHANSEINKLLLDATARLKEQVVPKSIH